MALQHPLIPTPVNDSNAATPATGLTTADLARLRHSLDSSISDNTKTMYNSAWRSFEAWTQARSALALPASPPLIAAYLAHLAEERRLSVATIRLHRAALAAVHKASGHEDPTDNEGVRRIMQDIARAHGKAQRQAKPLTAEALAAVKATARGRRPLGDGKRQESAERASLAGQDGRGPAGHPAGRVIEKVGGRGPDLGRRGVQGQRLRPAAGCTGPRRTRKRRAWYSTSVGKQPRPCWPSGPPRSCRTRGNQFSG